jgi:hypothetical protein
MKLNQMLAIAGLTTLMLVGGNSVMAQSRGNFDPAQMRQRLMDRLKEQMDVKDDAEWKIIEERIGKVMDARRDALATEMGGMFGGSRSRGGGSDSSSTSSSDSGSSRRRGGFFGEPSPEVEALRKAVDDKAGKEEIQAKLSALRKANKEKQKALEKVQSDLKSVLDSRQEAVAVLNGLLK